MRLMHDIALPIKPNEIWMAIKYGTMDIKKKHTTLLGLLEDHLVFSLDFPTLDLWAKFWIIS